MKSPSLEEIIVIGKPLAETIEEAYFVIDLHGRFHSFNDEMCSLVGYNRSELQSMTILDVTTAATLYRAAEISREAKKNGREVTISDYEIIHKDGSFRKLEITGSFIGDASKKYHGFHGVAKDQKEQRGLKRALRESEEKYRHLIENINEVVYQTDNYGVVTYVSPSVEWTGGYTQEEIIGHPFTDFVYEEDLGERMDRFQDILYGLGNATLYRFRTKDGTARWVKTAARPIHENGHSVGIRGVLTDVTDIIETRERLRLSEGRYRSILSDIEEGYFEVDLVGNIQFFNDSICKIFGYTRDEFMGINYRNIMVSESTQITFRIFNEIYRTGKPTGLVDFELIKKKGARFIGELSASLMMNDRGKPMGFRGVVRDVTERRRIESEWRGSLSKLQGAFKKTIDCLVSAFEMRDPYTAGHQRRVAELTRAIAQEMNFTDDEIQDIYLASLIHDIGKIHIPIEILSKPTLLTETEFGIIKLHPQVGSKILLKGDFSWPIDKIIHQHHERLNGQGYPHGLKKNEILLEAQILSVADVVEAMSSHRPYRPALGIDIAMDEIISNKDILYNADVVDICVNLFKNKKFEFKELE